MVSAGGEVSFAVVVPMYNEEGGAANCVRAISAALRNFSGRTLLIVVNDGSLDRTAVTLGELVTEYGELAVATHEKNRGYGSALRTGTQLALDRGFEYVVFMDSDLTNNPEVLPAFVEKMRAGCDVIKASRYAAGGRVVGVPRSKVFISRLGNRIASALYRLPLTDCTNGFRALRTSIVSRLNLKENDFASIMEELFRAKSLTSSFCEIPATLTTRKSNLRGSSFRYTPSVIIRYLKYPVLSFVGGLRRRPRATEGNLDATKGLPRM
jgi:glycosyltransferase involved in cell wall biosynthesis